MKFITINGSTLDLSEYRKEVRALREELSFELSECLEKYGFVLKGKSQLGDYGISIVFRNKRLGLAFKVVCYQEKVEK